MRLEALAAELRALCAGADEARMLCAALEAGPGPDGGAGLEGGGDEFSRRLRGLVGAWDAQAHEAKEALLAARTGFKYLLLYLGRRPADVEAETDRCEQGAGRGPPAQGRARTRRRATKQTVSRVGACRRAQSGGARGVCARM